MSFFNKKNITMDPESVEYKKNIDSLKFNDISTQHAKIIDCELVNDILIDCSGEIYIGRTLVIKNKKFTNKEIELFYQLTELNEYTGDYLNKNVFPILSKLTFLTAVRLYNYMGAVHMKGALEYIYENYDYNYEPRYHQFICRKELHNFSLRNVTNLKKEDYIALVSMGYDSKEILSCVSTDEILPLDITSINENFNEKFSKHKDIIELVNGTDGCFIAGGFLVHCIQEMIKPDSELKYPYETSVCLFPDDCLNKNMTSMKENMCIKSEYSGDVKNTVDSFNAFNNTELNKGTDTKNFNEIYDIDIFCLRTPKDEMNGNANVATNIIKKIQNKFDCVCFTNSAVTTVFIRNSPIQIQIIACGEMTTEKVLSSFDLPCCRIVYIDGMLCASKSFHELMHNNWCFKANGVFRYYRIKKYENRGFKINTNYAKIIGDETCNDHENNKWYCWRDENKNRLLHMVKLLFSPGYEYTKLPLSAITIEWKDTYEGNWNSKYAITEPRSVDIHEHKHVKYVTHSPPLDTITINNVEILLCEFGYGDKHNIKLIGESTDKIEEVWNSIENIYSKPTMTKLLRKLDGNINNDNILIKRSRLLVISKQIFEYVAGKYLLDYKIHRCNLTVLPMATVRFSEVYINMKCIKLQLLD